MQKDLFTPRITHISWGRLEVEGQGSFKDVKVFPGGSREWDWRKTGTHHVPGIQPSDVQELLDNGATVVVLSKGIEERLQVCQETLRILEARGIPAYDSLLRLDQRQDFRQVRA